MYKATGVKRCWYKKAVSVKMLVCKARGVSIKGVGIKGVNAS